MVLQLVLGAAIHIFLGLEVEELPPPEWLALLSVVGSLLWLAVPLISARFAKSESLKERLAYLVPDRNGWKLLGLAALCGLFMVMPALYMQVVASRYIPHETPDILKQLEMQGPSAGSLAVLVFALVVAAPVAEESFFRGFAQRSLVRRYGFWSGAVVVSFVFGAAHLRPTGFIPLFGISMVLCWLLHASGSVFPAMVCHAGYNGTQALAWLVARSRPDFELEADPSAVDLPLGPVIGSAVLLGFCVWGFNKLSPKTEGGASPSSSPSPPPSSPPSSPPSIPPAG
jgi:membrane protease YdiL (CAAX protease family)